MAIVIGMGVARNSVVLDTYKSKGPSIYDVHTEGGGGQAQVEECGRGGPTPCGRPH